MVEMRATNPFEWNVVEEEVELPLITCIVDPIKNATLLIFALGHARKNTHLFQTCDTSIVKWVLLKNQTIDIQIINLHQLNV